MREEGGERRRDKGGGKRVERGVLLFIAINGIVEGF